MDLLSHDTLQYGALASGIFAVMRVYSMARESIATRITHDRDIKELKDQSENWKEANDIHQKLAMDLRDIQYQNKILELDIKRLEKEESKIIGKLDKIFETQGEIKKELNIRLTALETAYKLKH